MIFDDTTTIYSVMGTSIALFDSETAYGIHTCAEVQDDYYYFGNTSGVSIETAVDCWQYINGRSLTQVEMREVMVENGLLAPEEA